MLRFTKVLCLVGKSTPTGKKETQVPEDEDDEDEDDEEVDLNTKGKGDVPTCTVAAFSSIGMPHVLVVRCRLRNSVLLRFMKVYESLVPCPVSTSELRNSV